MKIMYARKWKSELSIIQTQHVQNLRVKSREMDKEDSLQRHNRLTEKIITFSIYLMKFNFQHLNFSSWFQA